MHAHYSNLLGGKPATRVMPGPDIDKYPVSYKYDGDTQPFSLGEYLKKYAKGKAQSMQHLDWKDLNRDVHKEETAAAILHVANDVSPGTGVIPATFLKALIDYPGGLEAIHTAFVVLWNSGEYPKSEALAILISVWKQKGDSNDPNNYRGITAEDLMTKLMSTILAVRLYIRSELLLFLPRMQFGFRTRMRSTDAVLYVLNQTLRLNREGQKALALFVDFMKAFDRVPRDLMFNKLQRFGVTGNFLRMLENLYANTTVMIAGMKDKEMLMALYMGVLQGDPLSPLLFM
jgi:hypothetical protein